MIHLDVSDDSYINSDSEFWINKTSSGVGTFQVKAKGTNAFVAQFSSNTTLAYIFLQNTTTGDTLSTQGTYISQQNDHFEIKNQQAGELRFGTNGQIDYIIYSDNRHDIEIPDNKADAWKLEQGSITYLQVRTTDDDEVIEQGVGKEKTDKVNGYGSSHSDTFVWERDVAATFHFPTSVDDDYIHIELDYTLTATEVSIWIEVLGDMPTGTASQLDKLHYVSYARMDSTGLIAFSNSLISGQSIQWYKHSTNNTPVFRLSNSANDVGGAIGRVRTMAGSIGALKVKEITSSNTATL